MLNLLNIIWSLAGYVQSFFFAGCAHTDHFVQKKSHKTQTLKHKALLNKDDNQSSNQLSRTGVLGFVKPAKPKKA